MSRGIFVVGTDTGVGKTLVSASLLALAVSRGVRAAGFKPISAGIDPSRETDNEDVVLLHQNSHPDLGLSRSEVGPVQLREACSPWVAALHERRTLDREEIRNAADRLARKADFLIMEGAGGFAVPLAPGWTMADLTTELCKAHGLDVLLVVGLRLGCHSHALLTAEALRARGLKALGWVANPVDPGYDADSLAALTQALDHQFGLPRLALLRRLPLKN